MRAVRSSLMVGVATDVRRVRAHNEDRAMARGTVFVVADGMGGHAAGEVASGLTVDALGDLAQRPVLAVRDIVAQVREANRRILASAARHPDQTGMGTTVAGLAVVHVGDSEHWAVFNIGDSRVYRCIDGSLTRVTVDHSEVQELVDEGFITPDEARHHPGRNIVTRSLGRDPMGPVDTWVFPPNPGERFLLCTDGLSNELSDEEMQEVITGIEDAQSAGDELLRRALEAGGRDNATAIVVGLQGQESDSGVDADTTPETP
ncbi:MAG: protein phosphatase 2C domain-containing protein [Micrococcales bacterium]|nr:protein phosphatase 2C domain-containing protein [Micrococcales bacterium]